MSLQSLYVTYMLVIFLLCFILTLPQTGIARGIYTSHSHAVLLVLQFSRYTRAMGEYYPPPPPSPVPSVLYVSPPGGVLDSSMTQTVQ